MRAKDALGRLGEDLATGYLEEAGMEIIDRNWRCRDGELDIVARDGTTLVFCEVKTRSGVGFGSPGESVTAAKAARLRRLAACWLTTRGPRHSDVRIDVVGVLRTAPDQYSVDHLRGVC